MARPILETSGPISGTTDHLTKERLRADAVDIPVGKSEVGTDMPFIIDDGESPPREVSIKPFKLGATTVTNADFADFIEDTGYITEAERFGWSFVFYQYAQDIEISPGAVGTEWWRRIEGALWRAPFGPRSNLDGLDDYPVVHVSHTDATAFARWAGGRLPTEAEWEHAARGGLCGVIYPWGDRHPDDLEFFPCNIWQGQFPDTDTGKDGYRGLAPARSFAPNGFGIYNMSGNCWEWNSDAFRVRSLKKNAKAINRRARTEGWRLLKGGSHMCHSSYCHRYRIAARTGNTPDSSTGNTGFRIAFDAD